MMTCVDDVTFDIGGKDVSCDLDDECKVMIDHLYLRLWIFQVFDVPVVRFIRKVSHFVVLFIEDGDRNEVSVMEYLMYI